MNGNANPAAITHERQDHSRRRRRDWKNGILPVRIMCTISVCVSRPSTNQPDWNSAWLAGVFGAEHEPHDAERA